MFSFFFALQTVVDVFLRGNFLKIVLEIADKAMKFMKGPQFLFNFLKKSGEVKLFLIYRIPYNGNDSGIRWAHSTMSCTLASLSLVYHLEGVKNLFNELTNYRRHLPYL